METDDGLQTYNHDFIAELAGIEVVVENSSIPMGCLRIQRDDQH